MGSGGAVAVEERGYLLPWTHWERCNNNEREIQDHIQEICEEPLGRFGVGKRAKHLEIQDLDPITDQAKVGQVGEDFDSRYNGGHIYEYVPKNILD